MKRLHDDTTRVTRSLPELVNIHPDGFIDIPVASRDEMKDLVLVSPRPLERDKHLEKPCSRHGFTGVHVEWLFVALEARAVLQGDVESHGKEMSFPCNKCASGPVKIYHLGKNLSVMICTACAFSCYSE